MLSKVYFFFTIICTINASILIAPQQTALVIGFEQLYDISLLANTLSDQGIESILIIPSSTENIYEHLIDVEIIKLNITITKKDMKKEEKALSACEEFLTNKKVLNRIKEIKPTFTIFPALRHDACLLPWTRYIESIPVIWAQGQQEEYYAIENLQMAIPILTQSFLDRFWSLIQFRAVISHAETNYINAALKLTRQYLSNIQEAALNELYSDVEVFLCGSDHILRSDFATLTPKLVEIGCHHCRGVQPLPALLQKELVEYRLGTILVTLDKEYKELVENLAHRLPQGRQGQAVAWKSKDVKFTGKKSENIFIQSDIDRQDLIGYARSRVLLSHCGDTELLEAIFHGTPIICFPRNPQENKNAIRAIQLGFSVSLSGDYTVDNVYNSVNLIHENGNYREAARKISVAMRDRPLPSSDLMKFWLSYVVRNKNDGNNFSQLNKNNIIKTFGEDIQFFYGLLIGGAFGILFAGTTILTWYYESKNIKHSVKPKGKKFSR